MLLTLALMFYIVDMSASVSSEAGLNVGTVKGAIEGDSVANSSHKTF